MKKWKTILLIALFLSPLFVMGCEQEAPVLEDPDEETVSSLEENDDFITNDDPIWGQEDADIAMVVFSDFQCPFCAALFESIDQLQDDWIDSGILKIQYRDFPLAKHKNSLSAHMAAAAAHQQGSYLEMHRALYAEQEEWAQERQPDEYFLDLAEKLGLDTEQFQEDYNNSNAIEEIRNDRDAGRQAGVTGTPGFLINGEVFQGAMSYEDLNQVLEEKQVSL